MEIFKKMGPRVILVEHRGRLMGLVTVKDCLKYQFKVEAEEQALAATSPPQLALGGGGGRSGGDTLEERLWNLLQRIGSILPWQRPPPPQQQQQQQQRQQQQSRRRDTTAPEQHRDAETTANEADEEDAMLELEER